VIFLGRNDPKPNADTVIDEEVIQEVITNIRDNSGLFVMGYYDAKSNRITGEPQYRKV
jgi:hypothetical protein